MTSRPEGMLCATSGATASSNVTAEDPMSAIVRTAELEPGSVRAL
ncbi:MAG: hypothetical protein V9G10_09230 [Candidatus Nanopelagicales bacterium]